MVILDANILIRAVLGKRVREILQTHSAKVRFFAPDTAFSEAREHLPGILRRRAVDPAAALAGMRSYVAPDGVAINDELEELRLWR